jgi:hypothetical protein
MKPYELGCDGGSPAALFLPRAAYGVSPISPGADVAGGEPSPRADAAARPPCARPAARTFPPSHGPSLPTLSAHCSLHPLPPTLSAHSSLHPLPRSTVAPAVQRAAVLGQRHWPAAQLDHPPARPPAPPRPSAGAARTRCRRPTPPSAAASRATSTPSGWTRPRARSPRRTSARCSSVARHGPAARQPLSARLPCVRRVLEGGCTMPYHRSARRRGKWCERRVRCTCQVAMLCAIPCGHDRRLAAGATPRSPFPSSSPTLAVRVRARARAPMRVAVMRG